MKIRSGHSVPTSSRSPPIVRSATSGSAGPATRRSSPRPPATCTTASDFLRKWLRDVMADQRDDGAIPHVSPDPTRLHPGHVSGFFGSTGWGDAITSSPGCSGCTMATARCSQRRLPAMVRWVDFVWSISDGPIVRPPRDWGARGFTFGDWLQPSRRNRQAVADDRRRRRRDDLSLHLLGADGEGGRVSAMTRRRAHGRAGRRGEGRPSPRVHHRRPAGSPTTTRPHTRSPSSTTLSPPSTAARRPRDYFKAAIARADGRIGTGFIGTPALLPALVKIGELVLAAAVFLQDEVPGWLYQVKKRRDDDLGALGRHPGGRHGLRPADELLQPLCLWRGVPVAVRGRSPASGPTRSGPASGTSSSSRPSCRALACRGAAQLARRPHRGRLDGSRATR